ncbi:MAG: HlyD family secretion protein [Victivallaceae bacterium]|nr:HlyD family secretion protein [Victivallaceae bacterium]
MKKQSNLRVKLKFLRMLLFFSMLICTTILAILFIGKMEDTVKARAVLEGIREYHINAKFDGKISTIPHKDGERVLKGELLVKFDSRGSEDQILMTENELLELDATIAIKENALNILRKNPLPEYYRHTRIKLDEARRRTELSKQKLEINIKLFKQKVISRREYQEVEMAYLRDNASLQQLEKDLEQLESGLAGKIISKAEKELKLLKLRLESKHQKLELEKKHLEDYRIIALESGVISYCPVKSGDFVKAGKPVISLSVTDKKKFVAMVDETQMYKVKVGQEVRIFSMLYNYFEYGCFYGQVTKIRQLPEKNNGRYYYPVEIILTKNRLENLELRLGSSAKVEIITGKTRIIKYVLGIE